MFVYAIGVLPLIHSLEDTCKWTQLWYADDASAGGMLSDLPDWFTLLCSKGPSFGYTPQPTKCFVVVAPLSIKLCQNYFWECKWSVAMDFWVALLVIQCSDKILCCRR